MKKVVTIVLFVLAFALLLQANTAVSYAQGSGLNKLIVSGTAEISVSPDIATIVVGIETTNADASVAQSENTAQFQQLLNTLNSFSIVENSIKTTHYSIQKEFTYSTYESKFVGYKVTYTIEFQTKQLSEVGTIVTALVKNNANMVHGVSFSLDNQDEFYHEVLAKAVKNADAKAKALLGHSNFQTIEISEFVSSPVYPMMFSADTAKSLEAATIFAGNLAIKANITVTYSF